MRSNDADCLADIHQFSRREVHAVALLADAAGDPAGHRRADFDFLKVARFNFLSVIVGDERAALQIACFFRKHASQYAVCERAADIFFAGAVDDDALFHSAIGFKYDNVVRDVEEPSREVACTRRVERGVGKTLSRAVGRDEVFDRRQAFFQG